MGLSLDRRVNEPQVRGCSAGYVRVASGRACLVNQGTWIALFTSDSLGRLPVLVRVDGVTARRGPAIGEPGEYLGGGRALVGSQLVRRVVPRVVGE